MTEAVWLAYLAWLAWAIGYSVYKLRAIRKRGEADFARYEDYETQRARREYFVAIAKEAEATLAQDGQVIAVPVRGIQLKGW